MRLLLRLLLQLFFAGAGWLPLRLLASAAAPTISSKTARPLPPHVQRARAHQQHQSRLLQEDGDVNDMEAREALRASLLAGYDRAVFPFESLWTNAAEKTGLSVEMGLNFHRVFAVDVTTSVTDLVVWVRQSWRDPRLAWDPNSHNNISTLHFWIGDGSGPAGEMSEIWTPDVELWNLESSLAETLVDTNAIVSSDGTVFWSRPGHVKTVCKFEGLEHFPFDTLDCTMEFGSWAYSGLYLRPIKMGEGYSIGGSDTAGEAFAEFSLLSVVCEEHIYPPYPAAPLEDWPVLKYHVSFQRSWQPYVRGYLVLQLVLNLAAFSCFWLPPHIGERMSLAITALLAAVASELVVAASLPAASELTWFSKFNLMSLLFTALALFESAAVIYFHYHTGADLVPRWCRWLQRKLGKAQQHKDYPPTKSEEEQVVQKHKSVQLREQLEHNSSESDGAVVEMGVAATTENNVTNGRRGDADDFKNAKEMENNLRWQQTAASIDEVARLVFPVAFAISVAATFSGLDV